MPWMLVIAAPAAAAAAAGVGSAAEIDIKGLSDVNIWGPVSSFRIPAAAVPSGL